MRIKSTQEVVGDSVYVVADGRLPGSNSDENELVYGDSSQHGTLADGHVLSYVFENLVHIVFVKVFAKLALEFGVLYGGACALDRASNPAVPGIDVFYVEFSHELRDGL